ncbi:RNA polymerase sigma factor [Chitinophaga polysaccharea]|uniref:RNA polymerase sigma factor n=1 Tax=Chitinophaga polysaccharea TaxID=1293035 RepID=UPI001647BE56|nr:sigma factor [Chitinophaga polysaccharea]
MLLQIAAGEEASFSILVDRYWPRVYGHALAYAKSQHTAEEVTQDVFMDLWHNREKLPAIDRWVDMAKARQLKYGN